MIIKDQTTIKKKYYYYVAVLSKGRDIIHIKGTYGTTKDDFPLREVEKHILKVQKNIILANIFNYS